MTVVDGLPGVLLGVLLWVPSPTLHRALGNDRGRRLVLDVDGNASRRNR